MNTAYREIGGTVPDNRFHLIMLCAASAALTLLLSNLLLTPEVVAMLRSVLPSWASPVFIALTLASASAVKLALSALLVGLVLQFVVLMRSLEAPYSVTLDAALWGSWAAIAAALCRLLVLLLLHGAPDQRLGPLIPGSIAYFTAADPQNLSAIDALLNLVNPFELMWIGLVTWRLQWVRNYSQSPIAVAGTVWALVTLPFWILSSLLPALI